MRDLRRRIERDLPGGAGHGEHGRGSIAFGIETRLVVAPRDDDLGVAIAASTRPFERQT